MFDCIKSELLDRDFYQSSVDSYLFTRGSLLIIISVDNVIITISKSKCKQTNQIETLLYSLQYSINKDSLKKNLSFKTFTFINDSDIKNFLGVNINKIDGGLYLA